MPQSLALNDHTTNNMPAKRNRSADGRFPQSSTLPDAGDQQDKHIPPPRLKSNARIPPYLDKSRIEIAKGFDELEWRQRFRLMDAVQNPADSKYVTDNSAVVLERNRYGRVMPWNASRVKLNEPIEGSDYVNASPIVLRTTTSEANEAHKDSYEAAVMDTKYIASQGPKQKQFSHFWHMVHQQIKGDIGVIIMLTQLVEQEREKCAQYFPLNLDHPTLIFAHGAAQQDANDTQQDNVTLLSIHHDDSIGCDVRKLLLTIDHESKTIMHYLYHRWSDFGVPEDNDRRALIELTRRTMKDAGPESPRVVHCSAGVGRTGTWIALDHLIRELDAGRLVEDGSKPATTVNSSSKSFGPVRQDVQSQSVQTWGKSGPAKPFTPTREDFENIEQHDLVFDTVNALREQRVMMVVNEPQFAFLYEAVRGAVIEKYRDTPQGAVVSSTTGEDDLSEARKQKLRRVSTEEADAASEASEAETEIMAAEDDGTESGGRSQGSPRSQEKDPYAAVNDIVDKENVQR